MLGGVAILLTPASDSKLLRSLARDSKVVPTQLSLVIGTLARPEIENRDLAIGCAGRVCTSVVPIWALGTRGRLMQP